MAIRDRGMVKWQAAFQLPELVKKHHDLWCDTKRIERPILDEHQSEEFDQRLAHAMELNYTVKVKVWSDGFITDITGLINYIDPITKQLRIKATSGGFERVAFNNVVALDIVD